MPEDHSTIAAGIGRYVTQLGRSDLTNDLLAALKPATLDCIAAILSGASQPVSTAVVNQVSRSGMPSEASIIGYDARTSVEGAALANGTLAHACDYDEVSWSVWGHATAPVLPAVLAVAESRDLSGAEFLLSLAAGLETNMQIGLRVVPEHYQRGWHSTSTLGVLGAAAGASKALGLDAVQTSHALGIAASRAAGLRENFGSMTKPLHVGFAARDGCEAALLGGAGVTAAPQALEGPYGFLKVLAPDQNDTRGMVEKLGKPFDVIGSGLTYKLYPSCGDTHAAVDAALELHAMLGGQLEAIRYIRCGITPLAASNLTFHDPQSPLEAKFSLEYCIAAALVRGHLMLQDFTKDRVEDPKVRDLVGKTSIYVEPLYESREALRLSPAKLSIETKDGRTFEREVRVARGNPERPLTAADMQQKFFACADPVLPADSAKRALDLILDLERQPKLSELMAMLCPAPRDAGARRTA